MSGEVVMLRRHDFQQGDCVRLKAGGPLMLVAICDAEIMSEITCIWLVKRRLQSRQFVGSDLVLVARVEGRP